MDQLPISPMAMSQMNSSQLLQMYLLMSMLQNQKQPSAQPQLSDDAKKAQDAYKTGKDIRDIYKAIVGESGGQSAYGGLSGESQAALNALGSGSQASYGGNAALSSGSSAASNAALGNGLYSEAPGSMMATPAATGAAESGWATSGIGSAGNYFLPAAGAVGMVDELKNQRTGKRGYAQGAASGAAMGSYFGPWGALIGGLVGLGVGGANELLDTNRFKTEGNRLADLEKRGINIPDAFKAPMYLKKGRSKEELINSAAPKGFVGYLPSGQFVNNKFAESRNEADLLPEDIMGYSAFFDKYGNDWMGKFSNQQRFGVAQKVLNNKAADEHHGTIDVKWTPELEADINAFLSNPTGPSASLGGPGSVATPTATPKPMFIPRTGRHAPNYKPGPLSIPRSR